MGKVKTRKRKPVRKPLRKRAVKPTVDALAAVVPARREALQPICTPLPPDFRSMFTAYGILPHGKPLFGDGSTQCRACDRVMFTEGLRFGCCEGCLEAIAKSLDLVRAILVGEPSTAPMAEEM